jgi:hypothetical protein
MEVGQISPATDRLGFGALVILALVLVGIVGIV